MRNHFGVFLASRNVGGGFAILKYFLSIIIAGSVLGAALLITLPAFAGQLQEQGVAQEDGAGMAEGQTNRERFTIEAVRVEKGPILDGILDDAVWRFAPMVEQFVQQEPEEGDPATERTEVRVLYDARHLYIGVHAFDSDPSGIIATEMRRDSDRILEEDNFQIILDTFNDFRSGYMFVTSPLGAKLEQQISEEGEGGNRGGNSNINRNWDGVWDAVARRTEDGWTAEISIPTATLRFRNSEVQTWGINFERNIRRKNEQVFWAPIPKAYTLTRVSLAGTLSGIRGLSQGMDLRLKPFLTSGFRSKRFRDAPASNEFLRDAGLDMKYGVTSALNLDITLNTDFAQVEVDEQQVNLTRFGLFFPEKRDFFLENAGLFNVGDQERNASLFFSRRIGLSSNGQPIPVIGGARLTGKVGPHSIGLMEIQTAEAFETPGANFLVSRYSRDVLSRSRIGALFINKETSGQEHFNRTMALDANLALSNSIIVNSYVAKTSSPGVRDGDMSYYGRVSLLDPKWNLYAQFTDIQDNFNAEVGFVPRKGIRTTKVRFGPTPRPGRFHLRKVDPMYIVTYTTDQDNRLVSRRIHHMVGITLDDGTWINLVYNKYFEQLDEPFDIRSDVLIPAGTYRFNEAVMMIRTSRARKLYGWIRYSPQTFFDGFRKDYETGVGVRASSRLSAEVQYRRNDVQLPFGDFEVNLGTLRIDYAFSPRMTVRSLIQYNSARNETSTSIRFNWIYRPGSDIYVVYNDLRASLTADVPRDRQLVLKWTYLLSR
ncbi:MAG: DUF5916 domain-containing protein [Acidobacteria bacterium]|nr:DUF5916 domain-containing protein [Acidobacteriota bacterium]